MIAATVLALQLQASPAEQIREVRPKVSMVRAEQLGRVIERAAKRYQIDSSVLIPILIQESGLRTGIVACRPIHDQINLVSRVTCDLGIAQINWDSWGKTWQLNPCLLRQSDEYGIYVAARILAWIRQYSDIEDDDTWWSRYHDNRPAQRAIYEAAVARWIPQGS